MHTLLPAAQLGDPTPDEASLMEAMLDQYPLSSTQIKKAQEQAFKWINTLRSSPTHFLALETLMQEYPITSEEGLALMQLAESVLRVPDAETLDQLIADKLHNHPWINHTDASHPLIGRTSGWGAWLAGKIVALPPKTPF